MKVSDCPPFPVIEGVEFRHVPDWIGYAASDDGHVWSCKQRFGRGVREWRKMKPVPVKRTGHLSVLLSDHKRRKRIKVHTLVLITFVGPRPPGMQSRHYPDPTPSNNRLTNLQWGTPLQNVRDCVEMGRHRTRDHRGEQNSMAKLTEQQVIDISAVACRQPLGKTAAEFGVSTGDVSMIARGIAWKHVPRPTTTSFRANCIHKGEANGCAKLTAEKVAEIRRAYAAKEKSQVALAAAFGVTQGLVSAIVLQKIWRES